MRATLSSEITVVRFAAFAEMAWLERRPELGLICRAAGQSGNRITAATIQSALPGLADAGARNVVSWCRMLGLCDAHGGLTALGEDVAESDEAPVPEQGVYGFWLGYHPLMGRRVLAVERLTSSRDQRFEAIESFHVEPDRGVVFQSVTNLQERFLVRDLPTNHGEGGVLEGTTKATCRLRWVLDFDAERDQWQLDGLIETPQGGMMAMKHEAESDGLDLWGLAASWTSGPLSAFGRWNEQERRLAVALKSLSHEEQDDFRKALQLASVEIPGKGTYERVSLEGVPIGPSSAAEAQRWALSRFVRRLAREPAYRSRSEVRQLFAELTEETPLEAFGPTLPTHAQSIGGALHATHPEVFWSLAAPVDLAPYPVPSEELDGLQVGAAAAEVRADAPGVVRVPYRGGWSMRRLVDRLFAGGEPRRTLLCDRYVRGADNLATLRIFVDAIRAVGAACTIEVWTGDEEADFNELKGITGTAPRAYRQVFGRALPHDRYFLVETVDGDRFGWHLSNSPIHARADVVGAGPEAPLRWKDLAGSRVSPDELEPALRQWLEGGRR